MTKTIIPLKKGTRVVLLTIVAATLAFVLFYPVDLGSTMAENVDLSVSLRFIAQSLLMFVSFGVFLINWLPPGRSKDLQSAFISGAFLSTGVLTFAHMMTCRELLNVLDDSEGPVGSYLHLISGATMGVGLAATAFIPNTRGVRKNEDKLLLGGIMAYTVVILAVPALFADSIPPLCPHDAPDSTVRMLAESALALALVIAAWKYYSLNRETKDIVFAYLASATVLGVFSHAAFTQHESPYDVFSAMSVSYSIACYALVFLALFRGGVVRPYERLTQVQNQAERRRKEAEAATVKAQTYLDFLSHDVANMVAPIMSRAEMILQSPNASDKDREEAQRIVEQTQKMASLIQNLRRLSSAERIDARTLGPVELRYLFHDLEKARRESHPGIDLRVSVRMPEDTEIKVCGGSVAEDIIAEVFDNAIKHAKRNVVEIEVDVHPSGSDPSGGDWTIEIRDHGPGIPDHTKMALDVASPDPKRRFMRGIASSLSIMPLIAEQLGGRIRIEDRVPGDYTQGTLVIITLPRAT